MSPSITVERQAEALARAQRHWQEKKKLAADTTQTGHPITIALTREAGTPGTSVAQEVGKRLGWLVYDHELVELIAREMGLRANLLESVDERRKSWLLECMEAFASEKYVGQTGFVHHLVQTLLSLAAHGRCVIVGRGAAQVLPEGSTLRIRLIGAKEDRIAATIRRLNLTHDQAAQWVEDTERSRLQFIKEYFLKDPTDMHLYDLVLNTSRWSVAECADFIVQALKALEVQAK